jgi:hypothetical protein
MMALSFRPGPVNAREFNVPRILLFDLEQADGWQVDEAFIETFPKNRRRACPPGCSLSKAWEVRQNSFCRRSGWERAQSE